MIAQMQFGGFTHAKCHACKHLAAINKFDETRIDIKNNNPESEAMMTVYMPKYKCPICGYDNCEPLFASEVN